MRIVSKQDIKTPFQAPLGERIFEMIGKPRELGGTTHHSFVHVVIPPQGRSQAHYHKVSEETYYVLKGRATMTVGKENFILEPQQACLIMPGEVHKIENRGKGDLEFLAISAPAWSAEDSVFVE